MGDLGLSVNVSKTMAMKFRRGGRVARDDTLFFAGMPLEYVNRFTYLGLSIPFNGTSFSHHVKDRCRKAVLAGTTIDKPQRLSLRTALALFKMKVAPVATFGIELIWDSLSVGDLHSVNRTKAAYLRRTLGLHHSARNRLVYRMADSPLFCDEIQAQFRLPDTDALTACRSEWRAKFAAIPSAFLDSPAMIDQTWRHAGRTNRHIITRFSTHGFHFKLCATQSFHDPTPQCVCVRCREPCIMYHALSCVHVPSLASLASS